MPEVSRREMLVTSAAVIAGAALPECPACATDDYVPPTSIEVSWGGSEDESDYTIPAWAVLTLCGRGDDVTKARARVTSKGGFLMEGPAELINGHWIVGPFERVS